MENVFLHLFNMSITAGWLVLAVVVLRLLLKKGAPLDRMPFVGVGGGAVDLPRLYRERAQPHPQRRDGAYRHLLLRYADHR